MKIYLGTDHAGFELKEKVKTHLLEKGYDVEDYGAYAFNKDDDYPDFISKVGDAIAKNPNDFGIIFGGSGQAEVMLANKFKGVRAALFYGPYVSFGAVDATNRMSSDPFEILRLSREHNNANVLSIGARFVLEKDAIHAVDVWLTTTFKNEPRHVRRIEKMTEIENKL